MSSPNTFHLGLCMAGSITAGAYTAGVMDYLIEALENWQNAKLTDETVPDHQVVIDLLCGSSGGGMTGAMTLFALMDKMDHPELLANGTTYSKPANNILWDTWVELTGGDVFNELLTGSDIKGYDVRSILNSEFIDKVADKMQQYIINLSGRKTEHPPFVGPAPEMFMTLFNVTGINYELHSKAATSSNKGNQYVSDHRDLAHFRWTDSVYPDKVTGTGNAAREKKLNEQCDGRIPISLKNKQHLHVVIDAAKATGAFPVGLTARLVEREAKFIFDNPFFNKDGKFDPSAIFLGENVRQNRNAIYKSLNADGGTANNEPIELAQTVLLNMRDKVYRDKSMAMQDISEMDDVEKAVAISKHLINTSVLLIDPFPSFSNEITVPDTRSSILPGYAKSLIGAMNSQLIFDAKDALDAYKKANYGLHIISPAKEGKEARHAIACGSLGGFGGFLEREFRVHDFFLGRKNCQSFIRKYFVARLNETDIESRACVKSVLDAYTNNPAAIKRFSFRDEMNEIFVPIIPDVSMKSPIEVIIVDKTADFIEDPKLPLYKLNKLSPHFLKKYERGIAQRFMHLATNFKKSGWLIAFITRLAASHFKKSVVSNVCNSIHKDLKERELI